MDRIQTASRIHPVMAAAAVSVIMVSLAGAAAITGILPSSHGAPEPQLSTVTPPANAYGAAAATYAANAAPVAPQAAPMPAPGLVPVTAYVQPQMAQQYAPVAQQPAPVVKKAVQTRTVHHYHSTQVARNDAPRYYQEPAQPAPRQPNYIAMGTGAVIGGLIGNQVGGGNGKKLATVAGVIGGGMLGNEIANRNR
jgi:uncharacterized protein YcfJ